MGAWYALIAMAGMAVASAQTAQKTPSPTYGADLANTRYPPLDPINGSNFSNLELAWSFKTNSLGTRPEYKLEGSFRECFPEGKAELDKRTEVLKQIHIVAAAPKE